MARPLSIPEREHLGQFYRKIFARFRHLPGFDPKLIELFINLVRTGDLIRNVMDRRMHTYNLTVPTFGVLVQLAAEPEGLPMNEIGRRALVTRANITGLIDTLEKRGLVERSSHSKDRRVFWIRMTSQGRRKLEKILPAHVRYVQGLVAGINRSEIRSFVDALEKVRASTLLHMDRVKK